MGIHRRYMYSILDVREIMAMDETGKWDKQQLVRLKDPWANSQEWKGACSDFDKDFWSDEVKSAFNARNAFDEDANENETLNQRFVHEWSNTNDGVFVMRFADFMKYFNHLTVGRPLPAGWLNLKYLITLDPSKGPLSTKTQEWLENNQYVFTFKNPLVKTVRVNIDIEQEDIRMTESEALFPPVSAKRMKIGCVVIRMSNAQDQLNHFEANKLVTLVKPQTTRHLHASFTAENGRYCVIPFTGTSGDVCEMTMNVQW
jgi:hypothetical protein